MIHAHTLCSSYASWQMHTTRAPPSLPLAQSFIHRNTSAHASSSPALSAISAAVPTPPVPRNHAPAASIPSPSNSEQLGGRTGRGGGSAVPSSAVPSSAVPSSAVPSPPLLHPGCGDDATEYLNMAAQLRAVDSEYLVSRSQARPRSLARALAVY